MNLVNQNISFKEIDDTELYDIDGGLLGVAWLTGALLGKVFAGGVTIGSAAAIAYLTSK